MRLFYVLGTSVMNRRLIQPGSKYHFQYPELLRDYRRFYQNLYGGGFNNVNKKVHNLSDFV